jgi:hypothetical protein
MKVFRMYVGDRFPVFPEPWRHHRSKGVLFGRGLLPFLIHCRNVGFSVPGTALINRNRVARFFAVQCTKNGENIRNDRKIGIPKCHKMAGKLTKWPKIDQHLPLQTLQNLPKLVFLV